MPGFVDEVGSGDRRRALEALRDTLAERIAADDGRYTAAMAKQLGDVLEQLDTMRVPEVSARDQIKAQRAKRQRATAVPNGAGGKVVGGTRSGRAGGKRGADA